MAIAVDEVGGDGGSAAVVAMVVRLVVLDGGDDGGDNAGGDCGGDRGDDGGVGGDGDGGSDDELMVVVMVTVKGPSDSGWRSRCSWWSNKDEGGDGSVLWLQWESSKA